MLSKPKSCTCWGLSEALVKELEKKNKELSEENKKQKEEIAQLKKKIIEQEHTIKCYKYGAF